MLDARYVIDDDGRKYGHNTFGPQLPVGIQQALRDNESTMITINYDV